MNTTTKTTTPAMIHILINKRIDAHIQEHEGLYTDEILKTLRPTWYAQIEKDLHATLKSKNITI
jgi:hypothetical protein